MKIFGGDNVDTPRSIKYNSASSKFYMFSETRSTALLNIATNGGSGWMLT